MAGRAPLISKPISRKQWKKDQRASYHRTSKDGGKHMRPKSATPTEYGKLIWNPPPEAVEENV